MERALCIAVGLLAEAMLFGLGFLVGAGQRGGSLPRVGIAQQNQ